MIRPPKASLRTSLVKKLSLEQSGKLGTKLVKTIDNFYPMYFFSNMLTQKSGKNRAKFWWVTKILSDKNLCPMIFLSSEYLSDKIYSTSLVWSRICEIKFFSIMLSLDLDTSLYILGYFCYRPNINGARNQSEINLVVIFSSRCPSFSFSKCSNFVFLKHFLE